LSVLQSIVFSKTAEEAIEKMMTRVEAKDAGAICEMGNWYLHGRGGFQ